MLEFYYDFLDQYFSRQDFELCYMDTDSFYLAMSGDSLDKIVKPGMKQAYKADKKNWLATDKFSERTPAFVKLEFAMCYLVQNEANEAKINIAAKAFQSRITICIFSAIKMNWLFL